MIINEFTLDTNFLYKLTSEKVKILNASSIYRLLKEGVERMDIYSVSSLTNCNKYIVASIRIDTLWWIKKHSRKIDITDLDFKIAYINKQNKPKDVKVINILGEHYKDTFSSIQGMEILSHQLLKLRYSDSINIDNMIIQFDDENEKQLLFNRLVKDNIFAKMKRILKGMNI